MTFGFSFFQVLWRGPKERTFVAKKTSKVSPKDRINNQPDTRTMSLQRWQIGFSTLKSSADQKRLESLVCFFLIILGIVFWRMVVKFRPSEISWGIFSAVVVKSGALHRGKTAFFLYSLCILVVVCWCIRSILSLGQSFKLQKQYFTSNWLRGDKHYGDSVWDMHILVVVCV